MSVIIETRNLVISWKIISSRDIRKLFNDINQELDRLSAHTDKTIRTEVEAIKPILKKEDAEREIKYRTKNRRLTLNITGFDGSTYESESLDILKEDGILDTTQIEEISFYALDYNHDLQIIINLRHTNWDNYNRVSVKGNDGIWINGLMKKIEENVKSWKKQQTIQKKLFWLISAASVVAIGIVVFRVFSYVISFYYVPEPIDGSNETISQSSKWINSALISIFWLSLGLSTFPALIVAEKIKDLWKKIELQTGYAHNQIEKERRRKLGLWLSLIIIPAILAILF